MDANRKFALETWFLAREADYLDAIKGISVFVCLCVTVGLTFVALSHAPSGISWGILFTVGLIIFPIILFVVGLPAGYCAGGIVIAAYWVGVLCKGCYKALRRLLSRSATSSQYQ
jgi:hypothetical protein